MKCLKNSPQEIHKNANFEFKKLANEYKKSASLLKSRITNLKKTARTQPANISQIDEELKLLRQMYRTTHEIGLEAEHYYDRGWWRSEIYTTNIR